jgi:hypothetical protein
MPGTPASNRPVSCPPPFPQPPLHLNGRVLPRPFSPRNTPRPSFPAPGGPLPPRAHFARSIYISLSLFFRANCCLFAQPAWEVPLCPIKATEQHSQRVFRRPPWQRDTSEQTFAFRCWPLFSHFEDAAEGSLARSERTQAYNRAPLQRQNRNSISTGVYDALFLAVARLLLFGLFGSDCRLFGSREPIRRAFIRFCSCPADLNWTRPQHLDGRQHWHSDSKGNKFCSRGYD